MKFSTRCRRPFVHCAVWTCVLIGTASIAAEPIDPAHGMLDESTGVRWYDAKLLTIEGQGFADLKAPFDRLPARAEKSVRSNVWNLSRHSAGLVVRFETDATSLQARWTLTSDRIALPHMPATGVSGLDLYVKADGKWRWLGVGQPRGKTNSATLVSGIPRARREYLLYLPLYNGVESLELGIASGDQVAKSEDRQARPIVFYGTSITQGGCASRPGMVHTAILGRRLDRPVINLGFSGNGRMEAELAELLAEIDAAVYVIDCLPNINAEQVTERTEPLVRILRERRPDTPILLVEDRSYTNAFLIRSKKERNELSRSALRSAYNRLLKAGVKELHYLPGEELLGDDGEGTVDSSHPTDLGFMRQADAFEKVLRPILAASDESEKNGDQRTGIERFRLLPPGPGNPRNSEGDFIVLKDGRILFVYTHFTGGGSDHAAAHLASRSSDDGGRTWSTEDDIVVSNEGEFNVMSVSLLRLQSGEIALFYLRKNSLTDCRPLMRISRNEARTWSEPIECIDRVGYFVLNNDRAVQLKSGRIVLPLSRHNTPEQNRFNRQGVIHCQLSDDGGRTWKASQVAPADENITLQEPGVIEMKSGRLMMFCRTPHDRQYVSFSDDQGQSWSKFAPSNIVSPLSPASIELIPQTGDWLLVWNNHQDVAEEYKGKRTPFNVAVSKDEGETWRHIRTIEDDPHGWYCYTAIEFIGDDVLLGHCAGDRRQGGLNTTQITRISLDWLYQHDTSSNAASPK